MSWVDLRRSAIRSESEPRLVVEFVEGLSVREVSVRTESVASGVRADPVDGACVDPIRDEFCRTRELSGVAGVEDRVELSLGVGFTFLDGL